MITIKPSKSADTRSARGEITKHELFEASIQHIGDVRKGIDLFREMLLEVAWRHDHTKIDEAGLEEFYDAFSKGYVGDEFKKEPWYRRHITEERHHLNDRCPEDVNLIDILERVADIVMAGMGRTGEVYAEELDPDILQRAYLNTIELLKSQVVIEE